MKKDFLLELGCENIPSGYLDRALRQIEDIFEKGFSEQRVPLDSIEVLGTQNRIVVSVAGLANKQDASEERIVGPPVSIAITPDGEFTKAASGFAGKQGVPVAKLSRIETEKGEYLAVVKRIAGRSTVSVLKERLPVWLQAVRFPKAMRWDDSGFRFARPIRWVLCLYGDSLLRFRLGSLTSGVTTRLSCYYDTATPVEGIARYFTLMKRTRIILDPEKRCESVRSMAREAAGKLGGSLIEDEELVRSVANLLESPVVMAGHFDKAFLRLPKEVIVTALKSHQRYFSVTDRRGKLKPYFVAFANGARKNKGEILKGYERVLQARLADAEFYYREDTSKPLEELASKLDGIVWLEGLGTLAQKTERMEKLGLWLLSCREGDPVPELESHVRRAAGLAKADLASEMVKDGKEFTLLQGYIGREYALVSGEDAEVAAAIYEHYLPRFSGDEMPVTDTGTILSITDRLDTIAGCYLLGFEPTGSQDPYALRRHALGLLRISIEKAFPVPLPGAIDLALGLFEHENLMPEGADATGASERIMDFFTQRLIVMLRGAGLDYDLVAAVLSAPWEIPSDAREMVSELQDMRADARLSPFVLAMKRIANIIPAAMRGEVTRRIGMNALEAFAGRDEVGLGFSSSLFSEKAEKDLYDAMSVASEKLLDLFRRGEARRCFSVLAGLVPHINTYFDDVLVNCKEEGRRNNRKSFLLSSYRVFALYCNFSLIAGE